MMGLTPVQSKCLDFLRSESAAGRPAPSYNEIANHIGIKSRGYVCQILKDMEARGAVRRYPRRYRSIEVVDQSAQRHIAIRPDLWDMLVKFTNLECVSVDAAVHQFIRDGLEGA